jgi:hypothetical protein
MSDFVQKVCLFNKIAGTENEFDPRMTALYIGLCLEEMAEIIEACGARPAFKSMHDAMQYWSMRFKEGDFDENMKYINRKAALDGFIDTAVVAIGGAWAIGADVPGSCNEIAESNLSKYDLQPDGSFLVHRDKNGKIKKGPNYRAPNLEQYLK